MPKRKFDKLRDDEAIEREKRWRKAKLRSRREGVEMIQEGWEDWAKPAQPDNSAVLGQGHAKMKNEQLEISNCSFLISNFSSQENISFIRWKNPLSPAVGFGLKFGLSFRRSIAARSSRFRFCGTHTWTWINWSPRP
jgi:hypothetical protein